MGGRRRCRSTLKRKSASARSRWRDVFLAMEHRQQSRRGLGITDGFAFVPPSVAVSVRHPLGIGTERSPHHQSRETFSRPAKSYLTNSAKCDRQRDSAATFRILHKRLRKRDVAASPVAARGAQNLGAVLARSDLPCVLARPPQQGPRLVPADAYSATLCTGSIFAPHVRLSIPKRIRFGLGELELGDRNLWDASPSPRPRLRTKLQNSAKKTGGYVKL
jgi:hypothetical protein